jgi:hypothetical protein
MNREEIEEVKDSVLVFFEDPACANASASEMYEVLEEASADVDGEGAWPSYFVFRDILKEMERDGLLICDGVLYRLVSKS